MLFWLSWFYRTLLRCAISVNVWMVFNVIVVGNARLGWSSFCRYRYPALLLQVRRHIARIPNRHCDPDPQEWYTGGWSGGQPDMILGLDQKAGEQHTWDTRPLRTVASQDVQPVFPQPIRTMDGSRSRRACAHCCAFRVYSSAVSRPTCQGPYISFPARYIEYIYTKSDKNTCQVPSISRDEVRVSLHCFDVAVMPNMYWCFRCSTQPSQGHLQEYPCPLEVILSTLNGS